MEVFNPEREGISQVVGSVCENGNVLLAAAHGFDVIAVQFVNTCATINCQFLNQFSLQSEPTTVSLDAFDTFRVFCVGDKSATDAGSVCIQVFTDETFSKDGDGLGDGEAQVIAPVMGRVKSTLADQVGISLVLPVASKSISSCP